MKKIEIGSGKNKRDGYESCDIRDIPGIDHVCKADELPFADNSIDEIYSRHLIEHFTLKEFLKVLVEWNRVLKVGGKLHIICPNLLWHLKQIIKGTHKSFYKKRGGTITVIGDLEACLDGSKMNLMYINSDIIFGY